MNVNEQDVISVTSRKEAVSARQVIMYFAKRLTRLSLKSIAENFQGESENGKKDHTSVIYSIEVVNNLMDTDSDFRSMIKNILERIQNSSD